LARAGIPCLLLKGAGLSYSVYHEPWLRPRNDNDLLVAPADAERAGRVLADLGYRGLQVLQGDNERPFVMSGGAGLPQVIDLHWKISNRPVVADLLTFEELQAQSVPVPALGPRARRLGDVHALILACVHMAAHHRNLEHLLWCYDLHLLA